MRPFFPALAASALALAAMPPGAALATPIEKFHGWWEKAGQACQYSKERIEGDYFLIGPDRFAYSSGLCPDPVFKLSGTRLSITAHCSFGESEESSPVAEEFTLGDKALDANGTRTSGRYEYCGPEK